MYLKLCLIIFTVIIQQSSGLLRCYTCGFSSADSDQSCLTITNSTLSADCPYAYCIIFRQEFMDPRGVVASFYRGCDDEPDYLNHDISDPSFHTYYRACTTDLCNIGDGVQSVVGGSLSPNPVYEGANLLVPGTGGSTTVQFSLFLMLLTFLVNYI